MSTRLNKLGPVVLLSVLLLGVSACSTSTSESSSGGSAAPAPASDAPSAPSAPSGPSTAPGDSEPSGGPAQPQAGNGCPANGVKTPAGARTGKTADLDLDGKPDTLWLLDNSNGRTVGVTTATGATFSTTYQNASPAAAQALGQKLAGAGPAIVLVDLSRVVLLYDVVNCSLVPARNAQGHPYTFDRGFTGYGTGVECVRTGSGYTLAGLLAAPETTGGGFRVTRTTIRLSDVGKQARNGVTTTLARHAATDSDLVQHARTVSCGGGPQVQEVG